MQFVRAKCIAKLKHSLMRRCPIWWRHSIRGEFFIADTVDFFKGRMQSISCIWKDEPLHR